MFYKILKYCTIMEKDLENEDSTCFTIKKKQVSAECHGIIVKIVFVNPNT
jgi:hypothetical protein